MKKPCFVRRVLRFVENIVIEYEYVRLTLPCWDLDPELLFVNAELRVDANLDTGFLCI